MMPHWILALRSRKRPGSPASALTTGMMRKTYTGMNTVNRLNQRPPAITYCSGSTTKKASSRLRWSARRVCIRVMNSRSAKNDTVAKASVAPTGPLIHAPQNSSAPAHSAPRSRSQRRRRWLASASRQVSTVKARLANTSRPNRIRNSSATCWSAESSRRLRMRLQATSGRSASTA